MRIFKYPLEVVDIQAVLMPEGAKILSVQDQQGQLCLWAEVNPDAPLGCRKFRIYGTGHDIYEDEKRTFIGTVQQRSGYLVWHIYEIN